MLRDILFLFLVVNVFTSCMAPEEKTEGSSSSAGSKTPTKHCYKYVTENDTISLDIIHDGKRGTGTLLYNLKGKDRNTGAIEGEIKNSILIANYTFMSEGIQSVRQVAFKLEEHRVIEGYGESYMQNDTLFFKNTDSLTFNHSIKLLEAPCP